MSTMRPAKLSAVVCRAVRDGSTSSLTRETENGRDEARAQSLGLTRRRRLSSLTRHDDEQRIITSLGGPDALLEPRAIVEQLLDGDDVLLDELRHPVRM